MNRTEIRVRYSETDQMGVVYHANYLAWFEVGRVEYLRDIGLDYRAMESQGIMVPVLEVNCKYRHPAKYDDIVTVETRLSEVKRAKFYFEYMVFRKEDSELLATGRTEHIFVDSEFRPINLKKQHPQMWEKLNR
ncbi:putative esterase [Andreesenia angusta]|uniref:Putative esterase n=1 Tax=Andreesenia angusta TaxID=39480 RepID=A0A1S1V5Y1_9FIRM|nr:thioesterase family protein [Andreesenia angusta]OHW62046.1 putative esterase [Andreesenia angusta]